MKKNALTFTISIFLSFLISQPTWADDSAETTTKIESLTRQASGGDNNALIELEKIGTAGNPLAQYYLGMYYLSKSEETSAVKWFSLAASQGHCDALVYLGSHYRSINPVLSLAIEKAAINKAEKSGDSRDLYYVKNAKNNWPYRYEEFTKDQQKETDRLVVELEKPNSFLKTIDATLNKK